MAYSEAKKAEALAILEANGGNLTQSAKQAGISPQLLSKWRDGKGVNQDVSRKVDTKKSDLADRCEELAQLLLGDLTNSEKREGASLSSLAITFGVAIDKMRLLRGESTQTVEIRDDGHVFGLLLPEALSGGEAAATEPADAKREG